MGKHVKAAYFSSCNNLREQKTTRAMLLVEWPVFLSINLAYKLVATLLA